MMRKNPDSGNSHRAWRLGFGAVGLSLVLVGACPAQKSSAITSTEDGQGVDETLDWNAHLIDGLFTDGTTPPPALRIAAIMNIAMFDAANAVTQRSRPFHFDLDAPPGHVPARGADWGGAHGPLEDLPHPAGQVGCCQGGVAGRAE